jgi:hypothetical protein
MVFPVSLRIPVWSGIALLFATPFHAHAAAESFELSVIRSARAPIEKLANAVKAHDLYAAKNALEDYDTAWRGIEIYVGARDRKLYGDEMSLREQISMGLSKPIPDTSALVLSAQKLLTTHDAVLAVVAKAAPLNPLYDDVSRLRMFRAKLRVVDIALRAEDFAKARAALDRFNGDFSMVKGILQARSPEVLDAVTKGTAQLQTELNSAKPDAMKGMSYILAMMLKYNKVLNLVTQGARTQP